MRNANRTMGLFAFAAAAVFVAACGGKSEEAAKAADTTAAAAAAPTPESFDLVGEDGTWNVAITPANIIWRHKRGARTDSIVFDFKEPSVDGGLSNYTSIRMGADTHRIDITLATVKCLDKSNVEYTHRAQVWVDQVAYKGCADKK